MSGRSGRHMQTVGLSPRGDGALGTVSLGTGLTDICISNSERPAFRHCTAAVLFLLVDCGCEVCIPSETDEERIG